MANNEFHALRIQEEERLRAYDQPDPDVGLVVAQTGCTCQEAVELLRQSDGDVVNAIMYFHGMTDNHESAMEEEERLRQIEKAETDADDNKVYYAPPSSCSWIPGPPFEYDLGTLYQK